MVGVITGRMNIAYAQSGGPTAVINRTMMGVVDAALMSGRANHIFAAKHGPKGLIENRFVDLAGITGFQRENVANAPGQALGSYRKEPTDEEAATIVCNLQRHDIRALLYNGGDDSARAAAIIQAAAASSRYELLVFHVPKTIDADLLANDHTPGYPSAARFLATAMSWIDCDNRSLPGVYIAVTMGKNAGFLVASTALARNPEYEDSSPHLIYMPERLFDEEQFVHDVKRVYGQFGRCVVAVSEGIGKLVDGKFTELVVALGKSLGGDGFGGLTLSGTISLADALVGIVKEGIEGVRVRGGTFGYEQRVAAGAVSPIDRVEAYDVGRYGVYAAGLADGGSKNIGSCGVSWPDWTSLSGRTTEGGSVVIVQRPMNELVNGTPEQYSATLNLVPLDVVAPPKAKGLPLKKFMPPEFISPNGTDVTPAFFKYAGPLVGDIERFGRLELPEVGPDEK